MSNSGTCYYVVLFKLTNRLECGGIESNQRIFFIGFLLFFLFKLVGLLSSILAILFLLTCLYHLFCRRRYYTDSEIPTSVGLVEKNGGIPVTTSSQTATTTFINEPGKEMKINTYSEQGKTSTGNGDFVVGMPNLTNGHTGSSGVNGLLANGNADPSELRLLQHEHH